MIFVRAINWIKGYLVLGIKGHSQEKILNTAVKKDIMLWNIEKNGTDSMICKTNIKSLKKIRKFKNKTGKITILEKKGLPFILHRYKKRAGFLVGTILFFVLLWLMSSFVWNIEIIGLETITKEEIIEALAENNIKNGAFVPMLDINDTEQAILIKFEKLKWIQIELKGAKVNVYLKEGTVAPKIIPKDKSTNIIAKKDGRITTAIVYKGILIAEKGNTVQKGDVIVSGRYVSEYSNVRYVHSEAKLLAETVNIIEAKVPLTVTENIPTGKEYKRYHLNFFNFDVKLYWSNKVKLNAYTFNTKRKDFKIGNNIYFPIALTQENFIETKPKTYTITEEFALKEAEKIAYKLQIEQFKDIIINDKIARFKIINNVLCYELYLYCEEDIGQEVEITDFKYEIEKEEEKK